MQTRCTSPKMAEPEKRLKTVAVYCGANEGKSPMFAEKAAGTYTLSPNS